MKHFIVFSLSLLLFSCASVTRYEPKNNSDSLIIGKIKMDNKNFNTYGSISVNGVHTANIEISISNMTSGEILKTKTDKINNIWNFNKIDNSVFNDFIIKYKDTEWVNKNIIVNN